VIKPIAGILAVFILEWLAFAEARSAVADNFYVNLHAGPRYLENANNSRNVHHGPLVVGRLHFDNIGGVGGVAGGYQWENGLALEGEFAVRSNGLDKDIFLGNTTKLHGWLNSYTLLANGYYRLFNSSDFTPYIGGGVGISLLEFKERREGEDTFHAFDTDTQFAYQGMAGVMYSLAPQWHLGLEYRFFGTQDPSFVDHLDGVKVWSETVYHAHEVLLGVTYDFE